MYEITNWLTFVVFTLAIVIKKFFFGNLIHSARVFHQYCVFRTIFGKEIF